MEAGFHVPIVDTTPQAVDAWYGRLPSPSDEEEDLLDSAQDLTNTSRLSCQIPLTEDLDGLVVFLTPVYDE